MPVKIRKKFPQGKKTEETLKTNMHNLRQYNYLKHSKPDIIKDYRELAGKKYCPKAVSLSQRDLPRKKDKLRIHNCENLAEFNSI